MAEYALSNDVMNILILGDNLLPVVRLRSIPIEQQGAFSLWMRTKTAPILDGVATAEQDGVFAWDYARWLEMQKLPIPNEVISALNDRERRVRAGSAS